MNAAVCAVLCICVRAYLNPCMTITLWGISFISPPGQQIYSASKLAQTKARWVHKLTHLKRKLYMNSHTIYTHRLTRGAALKLPERAIPTVLGPVCLRLQEQKGEKTQCLRSQWGQQSTSPGREPPLHTRDPQNTASAKILIPLPERGNKRGIEPNI